MSKRRTARRTRISQPPAELAPVATMRRDESAGTWSWSAEAFALHGFEVGDVVPTTALLLSHAHPDDRSRWAAFLAGQTPARQPVVARLRRADGRQRLVVGVGLDEHASQVAIADLTPLAATEGNRAADVQIDARAGSIATLEQAKGVLMASLGVSAQSAAAVLQEAAARAGTSPFELAGLVMAHAGGRGHVHPPLVGALAPVLRGGH